LEKKSLSDRIWSLFSSVKLAIVIFSLIALTSIVGTIIEQQAEPEKNLQVISKLVGEDLAPTVYRVLNVLGFMDMYRSWWFLTLLVLFGLNLLVCSIDRFPAIWKQVMTPMRPLPKDTFNAFALRSELTLKGGEESAKEKVRAAVKGIGFNPHEEPDGTGGYQFFSQKTPWARFGIYIAHFSILIILVGAVLGTRLGFKGNVMIPEGMGTSVVLHNAHASNEAEYAEMNRLYNSLEMTQGNLDAVARGYGMSTSQLISRLKKYGIIPLGFAVRCDDFDVEFYGNTDMPKSFKSLLTIIDGGKPVVSKWIEVNSPLKYKGVIFYQASYGMVDDLSRAEAIFKITPPGGGAAETVRAKIGQPFTMPGTGTMATIRYFSPALTMDQMGKLVTYADRMNNPAMGIEFKTKSGQTTSRWIFRRDPQTWVLADGTIMEFVDFWGAQTTGLQVRKDPGVWVVYLGCILLAIGLFVAFFMGHKRLWVRLQPEKNAVRVQIAGTAGKNKLALERQIEKLRALLGAGGK
jgi:cytochrome c biogenesis protein